MSDVTLPPYLVAYLPYLAVVLVVFAFVAISLPLAKKPIAGTQLRRQSIVAFLVSVVAIFYDGLKSWELLAIAVVGAGFITVYYRNHLVRKGNAQQIAADKAAARKAQLASFLEEVEVDRETL